MSAFVGLLMLNNTEVEETTLDHMLDSMPHRGEDGRGTWCEGSVGLGHRMLHTTVESLHEQMPVKDDSATSVLVSHSRIDNRKELIEQLSITTESRDAIITDSDLILESYMTWGEDCASRLIGDFAFVIWDSRTQTVFCARDLIGMRPLFYVLQNNQYFAVATEAKAILAFDTNLRELNEPRLANLLVGNRGDLESTIFTDVKRLMAGHRMIVSASGIRIERYGTIEADPNLPQLSDDEYAERLNELMTEAVRCRLRSAFPISCQLSGGLDSSYVTCLAAELLNEDKRDPLRTVSVIFDDVKDSDEREFIDEIIQSARVTPSFIAGDQYGPLTDIHDVYDVVDDFIVAGNHDSLWRMLKHASDGGARVMLDGLDGDTSVGHGFESFSEWARESHWQSFATAVTDTVEIHKDTRHKQGFQKILGSADSIIRIWGVQVVRKLAVERKYLAFIKGVYHLNKLYDVPVYKTFRNGFIRLVLPAIYWKMTDRQPDAFEAETKILNSEFSVRGDISSAIKSASAPKPAINSFRENQQKVVAGGTYADPFSALDHFGAAHDIEVRHPFMDVRLLRFCLALPREQSFSSGWTRFVLRKAMENIVPHKVSWRPGKGDMTASFEHGLYEVDRDILDSITRQPGAISRYLNLTYLRSLRKSYLDLDVYQTANLTKAVIASVWIEKKFSTRND